jgi:hypothetical protein
MLAYVRPLTFFLRSAVAFSVIGNNIGNSGASTINWNLGISPAPGNIVGTAVAVAGTTYLNVPTAEQARVDAASAYAYFSTISATGTVPGDLAGLVLKAGVYNTSAVMSNSGIFTLDGAGDPGSIFILQTAGAYGPAAYSGTILINGAQSTNVFWAIGGAMTAGACADIVGNIITPGNITLGAAALVHGRLLAFSGMINLSANVITTS